MKNYNRKTLIMNADWTPINIKHWTSALNLIFKGKAIQVDFYEDDSIRDGHGREYPVPAVVALKKYIHRDYKKAPLNKSNLFARDSYQCQYCLGTFKSIDLTRDHVIPRSKWTGEGTSTCWTNLVTACFKCNAQKGNKTCHEADMFPANIPVQPGYNEVFFGYQNKNKIEKEWVTWLRVFDSFKESELVFDGEN